MREKPRFVTAKTFLIVLGLVLGVVAIIVLQARAPRVPSSWTAPTVLPRSAALPANQIMFDSDRTGNFEIFSVRTNGGRVVQLTDDPQYDSWSPRISPDRRTVLFYRSPEGVHDLDPSAASLWAMAADGTGAVELRPPGLDGWVFQGHAEWSPDQTQLVMFGGSRMNPQVHITDALGQNPRAVTDRGGVNLDPQWSPDGTKIAFVGCPNAVCWENDYEIYVIGVDGSGTRRVTVDPLRDQDPQWSPDGTRLAWLTAYGGAGAGVWDVRIGDARGSGSTRLFGDTGITSRPEFSADGKYIFVHRIPPGGSAFDVYRVRVDGSGVVGVTTKQPGSNEYPTT
jgi:Tol biopolymer transport system component